MSAASIGRALAALLFALFALTAAAEPSARVYLYLFWAIGALLLLRPEWLMFG